MSERIIVTFGEIMGRLAPEGKLRLRQAVPGRLTMTFGGAEANVAVALAAMGARAVFVTALPENPIADACVANLRGLGVQTVNIVRVKGGRVGLYFIEAGADQRPSNVVYDREGSTISLTPPEQYPWADIFQGAAWLHVSGITPAVSQNAALATIAAVSAAKKAALTVSCDLNFRKKLWNWLKPLKPSEARSADDAAGSADGGSGRCQRGRRRGRAGHSRGGHGRFGGQTCR